MKSKRQRLQTNLQALEQSNTTSLTANFRAPEIANTTASIPNKPSLPNYQLDHSKLLANNANLELNEKKQLNNDLENVSLATLEQAKSPTTNLAKLTKKMHQIIGKRRNQRFNQAHQTALNLDELNVNQPTLKIASNSKSITTNNTSSETSASNANYFNQTVDNNYNQALINTEIVSYNGLTPDLANKIKTANAINANLTKLADQRLKTAHQLPNEKQVSSDRQFKDSKVNGTAINQTSLTSTPKLKSMPIIDNLRAETQATYEFGKSVSKETAKKVAKELKLPEIKEQSTSLFKRIVTFPKRQFKRLGLIWQQFRKNWQRQLLISEKATELTNAKLAKRSFLARLTGYRFDLRRSLIFSLVVCLIFGITFSALFVYKYNVKKNQDFKQKFTQNNPGINAAGEAVTKFETLDQITLALHFPKFNESYLDHLIWRTIDSQLEPYINQAKQTKSAINLRNKPLLKLDYDAYLLDNRLLSLVFTLNYYAKGENSTQLSDLTYHSFYYDLKYHQPLTLEDILGKDKRIYNELAANLSDSFSYERQQSLEINEPLSQLKNCLFTKDDLVCILDPKLVNTNLINPNWQPNKQSLPSSRAIYANYLTVPYKVAGNFFNTNGKLPINLNYNIWQRYLDNKDQDKLLPFSGDDPSSSNYRFMALTINGLPDATSLDQLLHLLQTHHMQATFFVPGVSTSNAEEVALLKKIVNAQCELASSGWEGRSLNDFKTETEFIANEIEPAKRALSKLNQRDDLFYRPPETNDFSTYLEIVDQPIIAWNNSNQDRINSSATISKYLTSNPEAGDIVLLHGDSPNLLAALEASLPELEKRNYNYVTVSALAEIYGYKLNANLEVYTELTPTKFK